MKITIDNYEAYVLDFLEGNLDAKEEVEFRRFLEEYPEVKEELAGIDQIIVVPDLTLTYPHKESLYHKEHNRIIPLWRSRWMIAAAIALLLGVTTVLFIKNSSAPSNITLTNNQPHTTNENELPAISSMPAEQPETNVMAQKGNVPGQEAQTDADSPALIFEETTKSAPESVRESPHNDLAQEEVAPIVPNETLRVEIEPDDPIGEQLQPSAAIQPVEVVALLPSSPVHINAPQSTPIPSVEWNTREELVQFEIRIPGEFLSETWTDVSLNNIKSKLLPEFLSSRNNK